ncbi:MULTISPECIES: hypothetical protein [unclassified Nocardioides]|uniref:hypothetical protein n=1 Tax=unclassified Nocardioides TaxID=2615069 RepID=UPI0009F0C30C|nr:MULTISPECIES: hypothetical protein [unclassified Nocardioides]GAW49979.1 hypothetical protein PD653B2_2308 [Nocardioides sp. PD653-B2]GAW55928.1 hypothetical protein PD653_3356 [Nocardioides sp. PD653]
MATPDAAQAELAELRAVVSRAREQAQQITQAAQASRAGLRQEAERIRAERDRAERELRDDVRRGSVDPETRQLAEKLVRGEVSWRDVLTGDEGAELRSELGDQVETIVEELRATDSSFREAHDSTLRAAAELRAEGP